MLHSVSPIRQHIVIAVKKNEGVLNKLLQKCECHFVKGSNRSKSLKCFQGVQLSHLGINKLSAIGVGHLLQVQNVKTTSVRQFATSENRSNSLSTTELKKAIDHLTDQFMETRELLDDARESQGTVYFSDDMDEARAAVITTLEQYHSLLTQLSENQKQEVLRTIGLKMEELKAQEQSLRESLKDN